MANITSGLYVPTWRDAVNDATPAVLNLTSANDLVCLMLTTYVPNYDTQAAYDSAITDYEVAEAAPGYDRATMIVGGTPTCALGSAGQLKYTWSAPVAWTSATFTANGLLLLTVTATKLPIACIGFGGDYTATAGTFTVTAHANGIFYIDLVP